MVMGKKITFSDHAIDLHSTKLRNISPKNLNNLALYLWIGNNFELYDIFEYCGKKACKTIRSKILF